MENIIHNILENYCNNNLLSQEQRNAVWALYRTMIKNYSDSPLEINDVELEIVDTLDTLINSNDDEEYIYW